jgi:predicted  nucleic acid-binding Zn-ribbon protein
MNHSDKSDDENAKRLTADIAELQTALAQLERIVAGRLEDEASNAELQEELAIMQDDRSRLALDLDAALARQNALEKSRDEALRRLEAASEGVAAALGAAVAAPVREG